MSRGRKTVVAIIAINLTVSAAEIVYSLFAAGVQNAASVVVHLILAIVFFCFLYRGHSWARWMAVVLFIISGFGGIAGSAMMYFMLVDTVFCILAAVSSVIHLISAALLIFSPSVKDFFRKRVSQA